MKKLFIIFILLCLHVNANALEKVSLQLSWFNQFQFAGYYIAKEKGFYKESGLDVEIKNFQFGIDSLNEVTTDSSNFSIGRESLFSEEKSSDIIALYALFQASPLVLISTKDSQINSIEDFKNKKIMITNHDAGEVSMQSMIKSRGINLSQLTYLKHTHNINDLINKKTDLISAYISKSPYELEKKGISFNIFQPNDFGFDMYSDFLYTNKKFYANKPDTVLAFKEASLKGWEYAYENIEESVELILQKYNSQNLSKEELLYEAEKLKELSYYQTQTLGKIEKTKLQRIYDLYNVLGHIKNRVDLNTFALYNKKEDIAFTLTKEEKEYLKTKKSFNVCTFKNMAPFFRIKKDGSAEGIMSDIMQVISSRSQLKFNNIETENLNQSINLIKQKKCDLLYFATKTKEREKFLDFTSEYLTYNYALVTKLDKPFFTTASQLNNKNIAMIKNSASIAIIKKKYPNVHVTEINNREEAFTLIHKNQVYGYIGPLPTVAYYMQQNGIFDLKIAGTMLEQTSLSVATRNDEKLLNSIMQKALSLISKEEIRAIYNSWLSIKMEQKTDYRLIFYILLGSFTILLFSLFIHFKLNKLNKKLESSLDNFEYLFNNSIEAVFLIQDGRCIDINNAAIELFKFKNKEEAIGKRNISFVEKSYIKDDIEKCKNQYEKSYEIKAIKSDKTIFSMLIKNKFTYINQKFTRIAFCMDLTDLKNQEEIIIQQSKISAVGEMLGNIAHQWRQPLSVISMSALNLQATVELEDTLSDKEILDATKSISSQCMYLSNTIDDFRSFLTTNADKIEKTNLANSIEKVQNLVKDAYKNNNTKIIKRLEPCEIEFNEAKFIQAIINILNNANDIFKSENIKDEDRFVFIDLTQTHDTIQLSIKDSGGGINDTHLNKIFDPYFSTKKELNGTGIGLYITHQLITLYLKGSIKVKNSTYEYQGKNYTGAEFIITFKKNNDIKSK